MHNLDKKSLTGEADQPHHASGTGYHRLSVKFRTCGARDPIGRIGLNQDLSTRESMEMLGIRPR
jgi:hypothetical protein